MPQRTLLLRLMLHRVYRLQVPTPANPNPDGACSPPTCDVGTVPVGEFLYDHRNGSMLRDFLINDIILGPNGLGNDGEWLPQ